MMKTIASNGEPKTIEAAATRPARVPRCDVLADSDRVVLTLEMPGVDEDGVDVLVEKDLLKVRGSWPAGEEGELLYEREFRLSELLDRGRITAAMRHGLLTIELPKSAPERRTIEVRTS